MMHKHYLDEPADDAYHAGFTEGFEAGRRFERDQPNRWDRLTHLLFWVMRRKPK